MVMIILKIPTGSPNSGNMISSTDGGTYYTSSIGAVGKYSSNGYNNFAKDSYGNILEI